MATNNKTKITAEPGKQEIFIEREFEAPRDVIFDAFTDPEIYVQWLGPRGYTMALEKFEPRNGGSWRYIQKDEAGNEFAFHGVNHEVLAPDSAKPLDEARLVGTSEFEGLPGHVELDTARFEELPGGRTKLTVQAVYQSVADRDGMIASGMERGVTEGFERLDELLAQMQ